MVVLFSRTVRQGAQRHLGLGDLRRRAAIMSHPKWRRLGRVLIGSLLDSLVDGMVEGCRQRGRCVQCVWRRETALLRR